jgi:hypothetical protein
VQPETPQTKEEKSSSNLSSFIVLIILVLFGLTMLDSGLTTSLWNLVRNTLSSCFRQERSHDYSREFYSARANSDHSGSRPVRGANPYFSPSQKQS